MNNSIFVSSIFYDKIKVPSKYICLNKKDYILNSLKKIENKCSENGYIKKDSIEILSISMGIIEQISLLGSVNYMVKYKCLIANPIADPIYGSIITAKVENNIQFGLLCTVKNNDNISNIIEIVIPKKCASLKSEVNLNSLSIGDIVSVKLFGKKFHINDQNITGSGIIIKPQSIINPVDIDNNNITGGHLSKSIKTIMDDTDSVIDDDDIEIDEDDEDNNDNIDNDNIILPTKKISDIVGKIVDDEAEIESDNDEIDDIDDGDDDIDIDDSDNDD
jgi:DNA-directed RNA polymerase subunit E'/Rpb7